VINRFPRTFFLYFLRNLLFHIAVTFAGLLGIFILLDLVDNLRAYTRHGAGMREIALFYLYRIPELSAQLLPAGILMGSLLCLYRFARRRELTAIEVAGISPGWSFGGLILVALIFALLGIGLEVEFLPHARALADSFYAREIQRSEPALRSSDRWFLYRDELWYLKGETPSSKELLRFRIEGERFSVERISLPSASTGPAEGIGIRFPPRESYRFSTPVTEIEAILALKRSPKADTLGLSELKDILRTLREREEDPFPILLEAGNRISWALLNLTVLLATLPFLPHHGKRTETARGIFVALAIAVLGWALITIGGAIATSYRTLLGLLLPHLSFFLIGILGRFIRS